MCIRDRLYAFSFTVKMAKMGDWQPDGYFDYVVPPLEGLWWGGGFDGTRIEDKDALNWVSMIRQPDFVTPEVHRWAREQVAACLLYTSSSSSAAPPSSTRAWATYVTNGALMVLAEEKAASALQPRPRWEAKSYTTKPALQPALRNASSAAATAGTSDGSTARWAPEASKRLTLSLIHI